MKYCVSHTSKPFLVFSPCSQPSQSITPEALLFSPLRRPTLEVIFPYVCCFFSLLQVYYKRIDLDCLWLARQVFGPVLIRQAVQGLCYFVCSRLIYFAFSHLYAEYQKNISRFICMNYSSSQALCRAFLFFATLASITPGSSEVQLCFSLRHPKFTAMSPLNLSCFFQKFRYTVIIDLY